MVGAVHRTATASPSIRAPADGSGARASSTTMTTRDRQPHGCDGARPALDPDFLRGGGARARGLRDHHPLPLVPRLATDADAARSTRWRCDGPRGPVRSAGRALAGEPWLAPFTGPQRLHHRSEHRPMAAAPG